MKDTIVQIRVADSIEAAKSFYLQISSNNTAPDLSRFLQNNNDAGLRLNFLTEEGLSSCDIMYMYGPYINYPKPVNTSILVVVSVVIVVCIILFAIIGFYSWLQVKRCTQNKLPPRLITPSPKEGEELPTRYV